jgi:hypothetical protein
MLKLPSNEGGDGGTIGVSRLLRLAYRGQIPICQDKLRSTWRLGELVRHPVTGGVKLAHFSVTFANEQPEAADLLPWCALATRVS